MVKILRLMLVLLYTGSFKTIVGGLTTCHTQYSGDRSI